jgi:acyl-CoA synthetase (NDP forming)
LVPDEIWKKFFSPRSVAVIGASNAPGTWGERITRQLLAPKNRLVYAVNPTHPEIQGLSSYKSVLDIPDSIDLGIIVVRAELVAAALKELVEKKVKAALIISGGFRETGEAGGVLEDEIIQIARKGELRYIGPNTMGYFDTYQKMNTVSFVDKMPSCPISLIAQSGNMGARIMNDAIRYGVGINKFVCCGNESSIKLEDYLEYFAADPNTKLIMLYIEGLRDARRFLKIAREITKTKPIVAMKSGGTKNAARASRSHTGALVGSDEVYTAAFKQTGVIRVDDEEELWDVSMCLLNQPLPRGKKVGILTMGGGLGVVTTEACEKEGLEIATLSDSTIKELDAMLPSRWSHGNPIDLVGSNVGDGPDTMAAFWVMMKDPNFDIVISNAWLGRVNGMPRGSQSQDNGIISASEEERVQKFYNRVKQYNKPLIMIGSPPQRPADLTAFALFHREGFVVCMQPRRAARILRYLIAYREYLELSG